MTGPLADALGAYRAQLSPEPVAGHGRMRRWRAWLAAALAAAVLAGGAAAAMRPGGSPAGTAGTATQADDLAPAASGSTTETLTAAPPTTWRQWSSPVLRTWLPSIAGAGPTDPDGLAGYAHTPAGALAAAASLHPVIYYLRDRAAWQRIADQRVVWVDGQRAELASALDPVWQVADPAPADAVPVGFRQTSYSGDRAEFRLWWRFDLPDGTAPVAGALVEVVWVDGDWRLYFDEPAMDMRGLQARDSYLAWGPQ